MDNVLKIVRLSLLMLGVMLMGIRRAEGGMEFNPSAEEIFRQGDILIGLGNPEQIERLCGMI